MRIVHSPSWVQRGCGTAFWISSWCSYTDTLRPWGIQWPVQYRWGWCGSPGAGFPTKPDSVNRQTTHASWLIKECKQVEEIRVQNKSHRHAHKIHIKVLFWLWKRTWLSDSPWSRSNWTLDILAWKEHTMSVSKSRGNKIHRNSRARSLFRPLKSIVIATGQFMFLKFEFLSWFDSRNLKLFHRFSNWLKQNTITHSGVVWLLTALSYMNL